MAHADQRLRVQAAGTAGDRRWRYARVAARAVVVLGVSAGSLAVRRHVRRGHALSLSGRSVHHRAGVARRLGGLAPGSAGRQADSSGAKVHAAARSTITAHMSQRALVLGGGLTGLACAYELALAGAEVTVLEREQHPGGSTSSFIQDGAGGGDEGWPRWRRWRVLVLRLRAPSLSHHRPRADRARPADCGRQCRKAYRLSRILLFGKCLDYPLQAGNVLRNLPRRILVKSFLDYFWVRFTERTGLSHHSDENFEGWVLKRFVRTLYELFFGRYTGKSCP